MNLQTYAETNSQTKLANAIGVAPSFLHQWVKGVRPVPVDHCLAIERATRGAVTRAELRPNDCWRIWPDLAHLEPIAKQAA